MSSQCPRTESSRSGDSEGGWIEDLKTLLSVLVNSNQKLFFSILESLLKVRIRYNLYVNVTHVSPHPAVQFRGELGLELAGCSFAVVSLDEHFVSQRCTVPQLLQVVELGTCGQI